MLVDKESSRRLKIADLGLGRAFTVPLKSYTHEVLQQSVVGTPPLWHLSELCALKSVPCTDLFLNFLIDCYAVVSSS